MDDNDLRLTSMNSMRADASLSTDMSCENKKEKEAEKGKDYNDTFMELAFTSAEEALRRQEVPVGCVFVLEGREVVAVGRNRVNETKNACLHAEFVCLDQVLESHGRHVLNSIDVYVTVEPCIMCASMLAQVGVRKIVYGAPNERFGGLGSVLNVLSSEDSQAPPSNTRAGSSSSSSRSSSDNVRSTSANASGTAMTCTTDATSATVVAAAAGTVTSATCPIEIVSGVQKERAIQLLKLFYQGENPNAPQPKPKRKAASKTSDDADSGRSLIGSISNSNSNNNNNNNSNSTSSSTSNSNHNNSTSNLSSDTHSHVSSVVTPPTNEK